MSAKRAGKPGTKVSASPARAASSSKPSATVQWPAVAGVALAGALSYSMLAGYTTAGTLIVAPLAVGVAAGLVLGSAVPAAIAAAAAGLVGALLAHSLLNVERLTAFLQSMPQYANVDVTGVLYQDVLSSLFLGGLVNKTFGQPGGAILHMVWAATAAAAAAYGIVLLMKARPNLRTAAALLVAVAVALSFYATVQTHGARFRDGIDREPEVGQYGYDGMIFLKTYYLVLQGVDYYPAVVRAAAGDARLIEQKAVRDGRFYGWAHSPAFIREPLTAYVWKTFAPNGAGGVFTLSAVLCAIVLVGSWWGLRPYVGDRALFVPMLLAPLLLMHTTWHNITLPDWWGTLAVMLSALALLRKHHLLAGLFALAAALMRETTAVWLLGVAVMTALAAWRGFGRWRRPVWYLALFAVFGVGYALHYRAGGPFIGTEKAALTVFGILENSASRPLQQRLLAPAAYMMFPYGFLRVSGVVFMVLAPIGYWFGLRRNPEGRLIMAGYSVFWLALMATLGGSSSYWGQLATPFAILGSALLLTLSDAYFTPGLPSDAPAARRPPATPRPGDWPRKLRFVLPAYNESASIGELIERIADVMAEANQDYAVLVVDDGSSDGTADAARAAGEGRNVTVVSNEKNRGLGATIARGLKAAVKASGDADAIVTLDADLTQDPRYVPSMIARYREGADVVIASRFRPGSKVIGLSPFRHLMTFGARTAFSLFMPVEGVRDYSCGFRLYAAPVLADALARFGDDLVSQRGFACMVEIAAKLRHLARFSEVPFELHYEAKRTASTMNVGATVRSYFTVIDGVRRLEVMGRLPW